MDKPIFQSGKNIAIKVPPEAFESTVRFYKDIIGLPTQGCEYPDSEIFKFGDKNLWIDSVSSLSQSEVWLELETDNLEAAKDYLKAHGVVRRDDIEALPEEIKGIWIKSDAGTIHLLSEIEKKAEPVAGTDAAR